MDIIILYVSDVLQRLYEIGKHCDTFATNSRHYTSEFRFQHVRADIRI